jgi:hypothetical protein
VTYLFNIPCIGEELAIHGFELIGAWPEHLRDDVWSSLRRRQHRADARAMSRGD